MKLVITVKQGPTKKPRTIETPISEATTSLETMRKIWETEQMLNSLPGSNLRWHFDLVQE